MPSETITASNEAVSTLENEPVNDVESGAGNPIGPSLVDESSNKLPNTTEEEPVSDSSTISPITSISPVASSSTDDAIPTLPETTGTTSVVTAESLAANKKMKKNRIKSLVKQYWKLTAACAASMFAGVLLQGALFDSAPTDSLATEEPERVVYTATVARRTEPISPVVPFETLDPNIIDLGRRLFHESALSGNGKFSCASCHDLTSGGADGMKIPKGFGGQAASRNTPTVFNVGFNLAQYWDGRAESLEQQLDEHLSESGEMHSDWTRVIKFLKHDPLYNRTFQLHMGSEPSESLVRDALATYERSLVTVDSKFDRWLRGDEQSLNADEIAGYYLFKQLNCIGCHQGTGAGGTMFQPLGKMQQYFEQAGTETQLDSGRFTITQHERDRNVFRVAPLRNVEQTAPYFHDGSAATLPLAVEAMMKYQVGVQPNPIDVERIVAFLKTLTGKPLTL